mgnify:CR=1 FL=1
MKIQLKHSTSNALKEVKLGFSWTTLFFSILVPLFRGDFLWFIIMIIADSLTFGIAWLIFPFIYNKIYLKNVLEKGYIPANKYSEDALVSKNLIFRSMEQNQQKNNEQNGNSAPQQQVASQNGAEQSQQKNNEQNGNSAPQQQVASQTVDVESIISRILSEHQGRCKHIYAKMFQTPNPNLMNAFEKQFPEIAEKKDEVLLGMKSVGGMFVITKNNYFIRTQGGITKKNHTFVISKTNLYADVGISTHGIVKFWSLENSKKSTIGEIDDMAWPLNKYKDRDIQPIMEIVYSISSAYFGNEAQRPNFLDSFRG